MSAIHRSDSENPTSRLWDFSGGSPLYLERRDSVRRGHPSPARYLWQVQVCALLHMSGNFDQAQSIGKLIFANERNAPDRFISGPATRTFQAAQRTPAARAFQIVGRVRRISNSHFLFKQL
jgi:hypothetical protein